MLELLVGFFLLGSLSLAFRETNEEEWESLQADPKTLHPALPQDFDATVYEPAPMIEEEYLAAKVVGEPEIFVIPERASIYLLHSQE